MVEAEEIKARVSLRDLLERDNVAVRRSGASLVACCPIHREDSPSFHLHESAGGDWFKCFGCDAKGDVFAYWMATRGCDFKVSCEECNGWGRVEERACSRCNGLGFSGALADLASIAGLGGRGDLAKPLPKREVREEETPVVIEALAGEDWLRWERAAAELYTDSGEVGRWAAWRGLRPEVIAWAGRKLLCGRVMMYGGWREAFLIQDVAEGVVRPVGWHVRLAPRREGEKASWRYSNRWGIREALPREEAVFGERPVRHAFVSGWNTGVDLACETSRGLGAWPFAVLPEGGIAEAKYIFCCEGQWDALALIDVMGWEAKWPVQVAVFGMRGATSWKKFMEYDLRKDVVAFLLADNDAAGMGWFVGEENFADTLRKRVKAVHGYSPRAKDLNDEVRGMGEAARADFRANLRRRIAKQKGLVKVKPTFLKWLAGEKKRGRTDGVEEFAKVATRRGAEVPKGRARKKVWVRFMQAWPEHEAAFFKAWAEWEALK